MTNEEWAPPGIDTTRPSIARFYDYMLGGKDNFEVDRRMGALSLKITPDAPKGGRANRSFLRRVVHHLAAEVGVRQFLDIGSGLPTQGNVHEVATAADPQARVVYVDIDPMALAHGRALLGNAPTTTVVQGDLRRPKEILDNPEVLRFIDFSQPVGLLLFAILHHIKDSEDPAGIMATLRAALAPGSYVAISHFCDPRESNPVQSARVARVEKMFNENLGTGRWRTHEEILGFFGDLEVLDPGLVPMPAWRADPGDIAEHGSTYHTFLGGVARKR